MTAKSVKRPATFEEIIKALVQPKPKKRPPTTVNPQ